MELKQQSKADQVWEIFGDCLVTNLPNEQESVMVNGLVNRFYFQKERLISNKEELRSIIKQMPEVFMEGSGGGMSFLNLCNDKNSHQWAEHPTMEKLVALAIGAGLGDYCLSREMWDVLPGGMPYVVLYPDRTGIQ